MGLRAKNRIQGPDDRILDGLAAGVSILVLILMAYPLIYIFSASFSDPMLVTTGKIILLPKGVTLDGYRLIFEYKPIWTGYRNTIFYAFFGTLINLAITLPCAYALSRHDLRGRMGFTALFAFTMFFSGGLIPSYLVYKQLGITNTVWAMLLPGATGMWNTVIARTYFQTNIPWELQEAAYIDGSSTMTLFAKIVLPLSAPIVAVLAIFFAVGHWNAYFNALVYLSDSRLFPLQLFLRNILILNQAEDMMGALSADELEELLRRMQLKESMKYGIVVVSSLPVLMLYPFLQKHFVKGIMIGSVKG
ncbi:MAG TPA: carbohydrate ABC transporter permease [Clostridia bacterium]|nr:carbohydrate ABC transporter permease [Clostridia bacterium]